MELYTIQLAKWRIAKKMGIPIVDTTVKSGESCFAPSWDIVQGVKKGLITPEEYTVAYHAITRDQYRRDPHRYLELINLDKVAVMCYCPSGKFCHRHLMVGIFEKLCARYDVSFVYRGEILSETELFIPEVYPPMNM